MHLFVPQAPHRHLFRPTACTAQHKRAMADDKSTDSRWAALRRRYATIDQRLRCLETAEHDSLAECSSRADAAVLPNVCMHHPPEHLQLSIVFGLTDGSCIHLLSA